MIAVFIGYSVTGFFNIKSSLISVEVIPFLILAIGVDNMFLIYNSIYRVPSEKVSVKIAVGLRHVCVSIIFSTYT